MGRLATALILFLLIAWLLIGIWFPIWGSPDPAEPPEESTPGETTAAPEETTSSPSEGDHGRPTTQERNLPTTGGSLDIECDG